MPTLNQPPKQLSVRVRVRQALSGPDSKTLGHTAARKGIQISTLAEEVPDLFATPTTKPTGRKRLNIFTEQCKLLGNSNKPTIQEKRQHVLNRFERWEIKYAQDSTDNFWSVEQSIVSSLRAKRMERPDWTVWRAAEYADILQGRINPEQKTDRRSYEAQREPFVSEVHQFWRFVNVYLEQTSSIYKGPKPSAEMYFKTALAALVTRHHLLPKGGNYKISISPSP